MAFNMNIEQGPEGILVTSEGDLDINSSPELRDSVMEVLKKAPQEVIFDFTNLNYLDSTGLGALMAIYKVAQANGSSIHIRKAKKNVRKLFTITELDKEFIMEDRDGNC